jgi:2-keto-3-deoxy-L-rhamnonate aldolase RhmA
VVEAGRTHGIVTGIHVRDIAMIEHWARKGMRLLTCSSDLNFIIEGAQAVVRQLKQIRGDEETTTPD